MQCASAPMSVHVGNRSSPEAATICRAEPAAIRRARAEPAGISKAEAIGGGAGGEVETPEFAFDG